VQPWRRGTAYSHLRAGHTQVIELVAAAEIVHLPVIVLGELEAGFALGSRTRENRQVLSQFVSEPLVSVLDVTAAIAHRSGELFARLRRAGAPIPVDDIWIAATTLDCGGELLTFDPNFERVSGLPVSVLVAA
jgi:tRNA(fMet)-specific endonuclease VapC